MGSASSSSPSSSARGSACGAARSRPAGTSGIHIRGLRSSHCSVPTRRSSSSRSSSRTARSSASIGSPSRSATPRSARSNAFTHFTGAPLEAALVERLRGVTAPQFSLAVRIRGGKVSRIGALAPGIALTDIEKLCADAKVGVDPKLSKLVGALGEGIARVEYGRAGDKAGVDVYLEPGELAQGNAAPPPPPTQAN